MKNPSYLIGIDLGTTNSTVAFVKAPKKTDIIDAKNLSIEQMPIAQTVTAGSVEEKFSLPSFLYYPLDEEVDAGHIDLPWKSKNRWSIGAYAKQRGSQLPERLISSSKSWLCHSVIDRRSALLPLFEDLPFEKLSPVEAASLILLHIKSSFEDLHSDLSFKDQQVCVTVPASFDPSARQLVEEAARNADYPGVIFLEEPQAAFYNWLWEHSESWRDQLKVGQTILVIDIGGGTTDFTLIQVADNQGNLELVRQAVGNHLLLGGDNFDLALALLGKMKIEEQGQELDDWQIAHLVLSARQAKEKILSEDNTSKQIDLVIPGKGTKLIGKSIKTTLSKEEITNCIVDGFFPKVSCREQSTPERSVGMRQIGLPYVKDPRVTAQLAKFLAQTGESDSTLTDQFILPDAILFNGGTLKSTAIQERLIEVINSWAQELNRPCPKILEGIDLDFAVSKGATSFLLARSGCGTRIRAGASRSYFIGVEESIPAVPGMPTPIKAVCVVPFGMEEGTEARLEGQEFFLIVGEPVNFRFFSRSIPHLSNGKKPDLGTTIRNIKNELQEHHPIEAWLDKTEGDGKVIRVQLVSKISDLGMLELYCVSEDNRQWKLEFDLRKASKE